VSAPSAAPSAALFLVFVFDALHGADCCACRSRLRGILLRAASALYESSCRGPDFTLWSPGTFTTSATIGRSPNRVWISSTSAKVSRGPPLLPARQWLM